MKKPKMLHRYAPSAGNVTLVRSASSMHPSIHLILTRYACPVKSVDWIP